MFDETRKKFDLLLEKALAGDYEKIYNIDETRDILEYFVDSGKKKANSLGFICDANLLASYITTILIGDLLYSLYIPEETIPLVIQGFMETHQDDIFMVLGCLNFAAERGLTFDGKNISELLEKPENE